MTGHAHRRLSVRPSLPIVEDARVDIAADERARIARVARRLVVEEPALAAAGVFGPRVAPGIGRGPAVLFEDHSETTLANRRAGSVLEYRTMFLAQDGDLLLVGEPRDHAFEDYCREVLGCRGIEVDRPAEMSGRWPASLAARCAGEPRVMARLVSMARAAGELTFITYMGTGRVWQLARAVADASGASVRVAAPRPRLSRRVNDKLWFSYRVAELLGGQALPPTFTAFGPAALAGRLKRLARHHGRIVVKVPDSAGSEGNLVLDGADFRDKPLGLVRARLVALMRDLGWGETFPLAVGVWEAPVVDSPSVQLWIPHKEEGPPVIQGIFSQMVAGGAGEFVGAVPSDLPGDWRRRIGREAAVLGLLFQELGYFGPCNFDAVLVGSDVSRARLHWIECNGRWTGVSIPLVLVNRLVGDWHGRAFAVVQRRRLRGRRRASFGEVLDVLRPRLVDRRKPARGVVVLTPARMVEGTGVHLLVLAETVAAAIAESRMATAALLGDAAVTA